jgi:hypothetical protein
MTRTRSESQPTLGEMNKGARIWYEVRGLNVFPSVSKEKATYEDWDAHHHKRIPQELFEKWIKEGRFLSGISVSPGVVYGIPELEGWYAVCIEWDKIEGFKALFSGKTVEEIAEEEYIEWHDDDKTRGHLWAYVPIIFPKKNPDLTLGIEVKGHNEQGIMVSWPSVHKNGHQYKPVGTDGISKWSKEKAEAFLTRITEVCSKHRLEYPEAMKYVTNDDGKELTEVQSLRMKIRTMLEPWPIKIDPTITIEEGTRHDVLFFTANSILFRYSTTKNHDKLEEIFKQINYQLCKPDRLPEQEIDTIWHDALKYAQTQIELETVIPRDIREKLDQIGVYKVVRQNPTTLYLGDCKRDQIIKAVVLRPKSSLETEKTEDKDTQTKTQTKTTSKTKQLQVKDTMIDAVPINVTAFSNPIDGTKTYKATFRHKSANGIAYVFTVGPGNTSYLLQELRSRGRFVKGKESDEALASILIEWEDRGIAKVDNRMQQPGYYLIDGMIRAYDVTQRLGHQLEGAEINYCIQVLDELVTKYKNPDIGPTIIKQSIPSPFGYIKKNLKISGDNWVPGLYLYGFTRVGKNTAGIISLAIWRKHDIADKDTHQLGFAAIDTPSRFGEALSQSTYEVMISEVGSLTDTKFQWLAEMVKHAIENPIARKKSIESIYKRIPALSNMILTSNYVPPSDPAFRSRFILIHWAEKDLPSTVEKAEFKRWFFDEKRIDTLGILGDFTANYITTHLEVLDLSWEDIAKLILRELYAAVGKPAPEWIDRLVEQDQIEAHVEEGKLKLRAFFVRVINDAYSSYIRTLTPKDQPIEDTSIVARFKKCVDQDLIPFLSKREDRYEIIITADIFEDLKRLRIESLTSLKDLANMIGGTFESCTRRISGTTTKVAAGNGWDFEAFLRKEIRDAD